MFTIKSVNTAAQPSAPITKNKPERSPWFSINDVLIQNRCWLCEQHFPRGKMKKVFQVSDLLTFYHNHMQRLILLNDPDKMSAVLSGNADEPAKSVDEEVQQEDVSDSAPPAAVTEVGNLTCSRGEANFTFISGNLQRCYDSYVTLMNAGEGKPDLLFAEFKKCDVEVWMSGLVCANSPECKQEAAYFIEAKRHVPGGGSASAKKEVNSMFPFAIPSGTECPPGCGCDNPWPFMP